MRCFSKNFAAVGLMFIALTVTKPATALTVFDPQNFGQNLRQVAESVKAFYQRNQQTFQLIQQTAQLAAATKNLANGNYYSAISTMAHLAGAEYSGALKNAEMAHARAEQLLLLASNINSPEAALRAAKWGQTLTESVINDSAVLLSRLEPLAATTQKLAVAMAASQTATGQTSALQAQTQVQAINTSIAAQNLEVQKTRLAAENAERQKKWLYEAEQYYFRKASAAALRRPIWQ